MNTYKLTIICDSKHREPGTRQVVGVPFSGPWFRVLEYWLAKRLSAEGLEVKHFSVEEEEQQVD